jgi:DNA-directed RNA polymerase subunit RPC12/RpoP
MTEVELCCPYCETVMDRRFHLHMPEHVWYECPICGHRAVPRGRDFVTPEDEAESRALPS